MLADLSYIRKIVMSIKKFDICSTIVGLSVLATLILLYFPFGEISLEFFHNDDHILIAKLEGISSIGEGFKFVFGTDAFKFRPVANIQYLLEFLIFHDNFKFYILYNIGLIGGVVYSLLLVLNQLVPYRFVNTLLVAICVATSKFFVYSAWNITGAFETLAAIFFLLTIYSCLSRRWKHLIVFSTLLLLTSERFLPYLLVLPVLYSYVNGNLSLPIAILKRMPYCAIVLLAYAGLRLALGAPVIVGTQTDNISESFALPLFLTHVVQSFSEVFGFSWGPLYLTGFKYADWVPYSALLDNGPFIFQYWVFVTLLFLSTYSYLFSLFSTDKKSTLLQLAILSLICAASVTFRLELRWLIPVFLGFILIIANSFHAKQEDGVQVYRFKLFMLYGFMGLLIFSSIMYQCVARKHLYFADKLHSVSFFSIYVEPSIKFKNGK